MTDNGPASLPSYDRPPVTEVVIASYFPPITSLHVGHLGLLWDKFRKELPNLQQVPPLPPQEPENFGPETAGPGFRVELVAGPTIPRTWFVSEDGAFVVQIQADRFVFNWRKLSDQQEYPRFPAIQSQFRTHLATFLRFLEEQGVGMPSRLVGEVVYVNTIRSGVSWSAHAEAHRIFAQWRQVAMPGVQAEDLRFSQRFTFPDEQGEPVGRLYVETDPVFMTHSGEPAFNLALTARGGPSLGVKELIEFTDAAHKRIVTCFDSLTTDLMHSEWGRRLV